VVGWQRLSHGQPVKLFGVFIAEANRSDGFVDKLNLVDQPGLFFPSVSRDEFETEIIVIALRFISTTY
jgi:hypothetical protein